MARDAQHLQCWLMFNVCGFFSCVACPGWHACSSFAQRVTSCAGQWVANVADLGISFRAQLVCSSHSASVDSMHTRTRSTFFTRPPPPPCADNDRIACFDVAQECRKCTVRSSGASTMFWGTKTEKELLRKNGLGKIVIVKELDKYVAAAHISFFICPDNLQVTMADNVVLSLSSCSQTTNRAAGLIGQFGCSLYTTANRRGTQQP